ncbi:MAG: phage tail tape measure protein [Haemophilus parainfluenzae]|nr:phage tail tape measure protein [Haemophilus parainfluenzae]MDU4451432.1 phage tail tape measure protein [Haemophilus parainfluenzae]MDU4497968.1 phage tail tape measure protein [Haemophilus parainfluenzae]
MAIQGLEYIISLNDQLSAPLKGVMKTIDDLGKRGEDAMRRIGLGTAGIIATGAAMKNALDPAIDFNRALNEIKATGREQAGLDKITDFALDFSATYGGAATDVVNSTNEIARAIDGLTDSELVAFSKSSNILAKATGSDVKAMGSYISQLYGIFGDEAAKIGKEKWVEQISAQATVTANKFKSSGESLMQAYTNLGSSAKDHGIKTAEQFAVIGNLQNVFEGGLAGTKYAAFLSGAVKAQSKLGLSFLDSQGKMLPMIDILEKIKGKYGELNSENLYELQKAFGTKEAAQVINNLLPKIDTLKADIAEIDKMKTLDDAMAISKTVTDSWMRFTAIFQNIKIAIGTQILAKLEPVMNRIADMGQEFTNWLRAYKNIARWIGYAVGALIGFTGLTAALTLMSGIVSAIGVAFSFLVSPVMLVVGAVIGLGIVIYKFHSQFMAFIAGFIEGFKMAGVSFAPLFSAFAIVWSALQRIGSTIGRIIGLFGSASDSAYSFQQFGVDMGYALGAVFNIVLNAVELVARSFGFMADVFAISIGAIIEGWNAITSLWDSNKPIESFSNIATALGNIFSNAFKGIVNAFTSVINFIIEKANSLPGINIPLIPKWEDGALPMQSSATAVGASIGTQALQMQNQLGALNTTSPKFELSEQTQPQFTKMPSGSISKAITQNQQTTKTINYGGVTINSNDGNKVWQEMRNREQLAAG